MTITDPVVMASPRSPLCQYCGLYCRQPTERHHIVPRGMGGGSRLDILINTLDLGGCWDCDCHGRAQRNEIKQDDLFRVVARREKTTVEAIREEIWRLLRTPKT
jgi:hypothetical protein